MNSEPIRKAMDDYEAAKDDVNAAHFQSARSSAYRHGWHAQAVVAAEEQRRLADRILRAELEDAGSFIAGVQ